MNEKQFELLMELLNQINSTLDLIDSRLYAIEQCVWNNPNNQKESLLKVLIQR